MFSLTLRPEILSGSVNVRNHVGCLSWALSWAHVSGPGSPYGFSRSSTSETSSRQRCCLRTRPPENMLCSFHRTTTCSKDPRLLSQQFMHRSQVHVVLGDSTRDVQPLSTSRGGPTNVRSFKTPLLLVWT